MFGGAKLGMIQAILQNIVVGFLPLKAVLIVLVVVLLIDVEEVQLPLRPQPVNCLPIPRRLLQPMFVLLTNGKEYLTAEDVAETVPFGGLPALIMVVSQQIQLLGVLVVCSVSQAKTTISTHAFNTVV